MKMIIGMMLVGCRSKTPEEVVDTGTDSWSQSEVTESDEEQNTDSGKPDYEEGEEGEWDEKEDTGFEDKPEEGEGEEEEGGNGSSDYTECGEEFDPNVPCQGDWTTTVCTSDGLIWWCDNGVWLNEEDK